MNNWIWWLVVLVIAILVDLLAITPLLKYLHRQDKSRLPEVRPDQPVENRLKDRLKKGLILFSQRVVFLGASIKTFLGSGRAKKIQNEPVLLVSDNTIVPVHLERSNDSDLSNGKGPLNFAIPGPDNNGLISSQTVSNDKTGTTPGINPDGNDLNGQTLIDEKIIETPAGSKVRITISLSPGQIVQIAVQSNSKKQ